MSSKIRATVKLPPTSASDIKTRQLHVAFDDRNVVLVNEKQISPGPIALPADEVGFTIDGAIGTRASIFLIDIDQADNVSLPSSTLDITFAKTFAPPKPGPLVIDSEEEIQDAPPVATLPPVQPLDAEKTIRGNKKHHKPYIAPVVPVDPNVTVTPVETLPPSPAPVLFSAPPLAPFPPLAPEPLPNI